MTDDPKSLRARIDELESELQAKEAELAQMRLRLSSANTRLEQVIDRVGHEVKLATRIQRLLCPVDLPHISGFEFSTKFIPGSKSGGDYFDIFEHEDKMRFGIVLSSCSGYTMSALFLSILMKLSSKIEARRGWPPHEAIQSMAREILPEIKGNDSASLWYGIVDRRNFELSYCSVGDICALHQAAGQDHLAQLPSQGPLLTKSFNTELQSRQVSLNSKDRLVLATPGLAQTPSRSGETWGEAALREAVRSAPRSGVHETRNEILYRNESFSGRTDPERDQTLLVLEVKDKVIKLAKQ